MRNREVQKEVSENDFKRWPLLREFRKTELFLKAFKSIYKKDFANELLEDAEKEIKSQQQIPAKGSPQKGTEGN
jgi:hypothetical protein